MKPRSLKLVNCACCGLQFYPTRTGRKYCSRKCFYTSPETRRLTSERLKKNPRKPPQSRPWDGGRRPSMTGDKHPMWGKNHSLDSRLKIKKARAAQGRMNVGPENHFWMGGVSRLKHRIYHSFKYKSWRTQIFVRDRGVCVLCGVKDREAEVDHVIPFSTLLRRHSIKDVESAIACDPLWDLSNGRVLCLPCHKVTPTYGRKALLVV